LCGSDCPRVAAPNLYSKSTTRSLIDSTVLLSKIGASGSPLRATLELVVDILGLSCTLMAPYAAAFFYGRVELHPPNHFHLHLMILTLNRDSPSSLTADCDCDADPLCNPENSPVRQLTYIKNTDQPSPPGLVGARFQAENAPHKSTPTRPPTVIHNASNKTNATHIANLCAELD